MYEYVSYKTYMSLKKICYINPSMNLNDYLFNDSFSFNGYFKTSSKKTPKLLKLNVALLT